MILVGSANYRAIDYFVLVFFFDQIFSILVNGESKPISRFILDSHQIYFAVELITRFSDAIFFFFPKLNWSTIIIELFFHFNDRSIFDTMSSHSNHGKAVVLLLLVLFFFFYHQQNWSIYFCFGIIQCYCLSPSFSFVDVKTSKRKKKMEYENNAPNRSVWLK